MTSSLFLSHSCLFLTFFPSRYFSSWFPPFRGPSWCSLSNCDSLKIRTIFRLSQSVSYQTPNYDQLNKGPLPSQNNSASGARHYPQANISWISCSQTISVMLILAQTCGETPGEAPSSNGFYREIRFNQILNRKKLSSVRCSSLCFSTVVTRVQSFGSKQLFFSVLCLSFQFKNIQPSLSYHISYRNTLGAGTLSDKSDKSHAQSYYNQIPAKWYLIVVAIK